MPERLTGGELDHKCSLDKTKYDPLEVGYALTNDILDQLYECAEKHDRIFDEDEYFLVLIIAYDPLIKHLRRHKYYAFPFLPSPRPQQVVFLYNKVTQKIKRLWSLPDAKVMATISEMGYVAPLWSNTKGWCDAFFSGDFYSFIRRQHNICHLSESEYLDLHREEFLKAGAKESPSSAPEPFDFSKIKIDHIVDTKTARTE